MEVKILFSLRLTFGCCSSPKIFYSFSEALCWILLNNYKLLFILHLLDDFLVVDFPSSPSDRSISTLKALFSNLNVPLSEEKTIGPLSSIEFLGITLKFQSKGFQINTPMNQLVKHSHQVCTHWCLIVDTPIKHYKKTTGKFTCLQQK